MTLTLTRTLFWRLRTVLFACHFDEVTSVKVADRYKRVGTPAGQDHSVTLISALFMKRHGDQDATIGVCDNR